MFKTINSKVIGISTACVLSYGIYKFQDEMHYKHNTSDRKKIVVIGNGVAGKSFYNEINKKKYDVSILSSNSKDYAPEFINVLKIKAQNLLDKHIIGKLNINCQLGTIQKLDTEENTLYYKRIWFDNIPMKYDIIVFAIGSTVNTFGIDTSQISHRYFEFKTFDDVKKLKNNINQYTADKKFAIIGGGISGVELASYMASCCNNITVIEAMDKILPTMNDENKNIIHEYLNNQNINFLLNKSVMKFEPSCAFAKNTDNITVTFKNDETAKFDYIIWTAGVKSNPLMFDIFGTNKVNEKLNMLNNDKELQPMSNIYAIGDCNNILPKSAQNAKQQGTYLAKQLNSKSFDEEYKFNNNGTIIHLHDRVFIESKYYTGYAPLFVHKILQWWNK